LNPSAELILWPAAPADLRLCDHEVHVWASSLAVAPGRLDALKATLSGGELDRAGKFRFDHHRNRFIAGRGCLRAILGRYLSNDPARIEFSYSRLGKTEFAPGFDGLGLHFNVAHSEDLALFAITRLGPVGVDVECIRVVRDVDELVARFFSVRENGLFQKLASSEMPSAFFNLWTRKEALLKATGEGITGGLDRVEVSFLPDEPAQLLAMSGDVESAAQWSLHELSPATGFVGAVAIQEKNIQVRCWQ
jgi:4'-phosphopantetheinyl transferase